MNRTGRQLWRQLPERCDVVQHPEAAAVRGDDEIVEVFLDGEPMHRRVRQSGLEREPVLPLVCREVHTVLGAEIEHALLDWIFADAVRVAVNALLNVAADRFPGLAVIGRFIHERIAVVDLVQVDGDVRGARVIPRRFDVTDGAPGRQPRNVRRLVGPVRSRITCDLHLAVIGASPDDPLLLRRLRDREHDAGIFDADVVRCETAGNLKARLVVEREIGADLLPALAAVRRAVHVLRPGIHDVVIVRRDRERERPVEPVSHVARRRADGDLGPDLDFAHLTRAFVEAFYGSTEAAEAGARRPDDVVVDGIGNRPAALAARDRMPQTSRNRAGVRFVRLFGNPAVARAPRGRPVLSVAVDVVRNLIVGRNVIHLRHWQLDLMPAPAAVD